MSLIRYYEGGLLPAAPAQNKAEQWDDQAQTYTAWNSAGAVTSTRAYTADEVVAAGATAAVATSDANRSTIQSRAQAALAANATFLALGPSPSNAQVIAQVRALTRQSTGEIRLLLGLTDSTDGT